MTGIKLKIMVSAVKIRMKSGESLEEILASYTALTKEDKESIRAAVLPADAEMNQEKQSNESDT